MFKKPKLKTVGCETCLFRGGEPYDDPAEKGTVRVYCKIRFVNVDVDMMTKFCDHYKIDPREKDI